MNREELKAWAKEKIKSKFWLLVAVLLVSGILTGITIYYPSNNTLPNSNYSTDNYISLGWILYFIEVGTVSFMVNFINDKEVEFKDIFKYSSDFVRCLVTNLLQILYVFLFMLLLIIPGFIKAYGYALVPYLLADDKYKDLKATDILKKSEEMMNGHKMEYFNLQLSFIGWFLLIIVTFGLASIYVVPYMRTACTKFLYDLKTQFEK